MFDLTELFNIISERGDPSDPATRITSIPFDSGAVISQGTVEDACDPDGLGRLRVKMITVPGQPITDWIPLVRPYGGADKGFFILPSIGEKILLAHIGGSINRPIALGSMYTPYTGANLDAKPRNNEKFFFSKAGFRITFDDSLIQEKLEISSPDGKMSLSITRFGIELSNELGDIEISTTKEFEIDTNELAIESEKELELNAAGVKIESGKSLKLKSDTETTIKGNKIKLNGTSGVTANSKQIAAKDDQVIGIDIHIVMVPAPPAAPMPTPLPHPFIGKLDAELSSNVTIGSRAAAVMGSLAHNNTPKHMPTPPGTAFQKPPKNEAEVTSGTTQKVKINGKNTAVITSMATSCDDLGTRNQSTVIAIGAAAPGMYKGPKAVKKKAEAKTKGKAGATPADVVEALEGLVESAGAVEPMEEKKEEHKEEAKRRPHSRI